MHEFDPRRPAFRIAPRALAVAAGVVVIALGARLGSAQADIANPEMKAQNALRITALQHTAFTGFAAQPGLLPAEPVEIRIQSGETFEAALRRTGVSPDDAKAAAALLAHAEEPVKSLVGRTFTADVARSIDPEADPRLVGVSMSTGPASQLTIARAYDGSLRLRQLSEPIIEETTVVQGKIGDSLSETAGEMGATSAIVNKAVKLFSSKLDFSREVDEDDTFRLVFKRKVSESGRTVQGLELLYAEVDAASEGGKPIRFYRFDPPGAEKAEYFDETGKTMKGLLLSTPLKVTRITSSFGMRHHPVLGYDKMHQGIDFAGGVGTPIYAAGDGVIAEAGPKGSYGNWVMIKHAGGWATGYAHMSRVATRRGASVKQGQLIGYVGATGRVTGPHLHYEVMKNGAKINPKSAKIPAGLTLSGAQLAAFQAEKASLDTTLAANSAEGPTRLAAAPSAAAKAVTVALRPAPALP